MHSIGDAVISTDERGLVDYMNPIAEKLTGYRFEDAYGQPLSYVFRVIDEHSRELKLDPVVQCLRDNVIVQFKGRQLSG